MCASWAYKSNAFIWFCNRHILHTYKCNPLTCEKSKEDFYRNASTMFLKKIRSEGNDCDIEDLNIIFIKNKPMNFETFISHSTWEVVAPTPITLMQQMQFRRATTPAKPVNSLTKTHTHLYKKYKTQMRSEWLFFFTVRFQSAESFIKAEGFRLIESAPIHVRRRANWKTRLRYQIERIPLLVAFLRRTMYV